MRLDTLMRRVLRQEVLRRERGLEPDAGSVDDLPNPYEPDEAAAFVDLLRSPFPGSEAPASPATCTRCATAVPTCARRSPT
jgi:hypothetical protein